MDTGQDAPCEAVQYASAGEIKKGLAIREGGVQGFFNIHTGKITEEYSEALRAHGLQAFMGTDASRQPGDLKEMMLHETAVAWITHRLKVTTPARAWEETPEAFGNRQKGACEYINSHYGVENLCRALQQRVRALRDKERGAA